ncbi:MAG: hypothetical protein DMF62_05900 [Acidobacteria bacterium]|nr:MAG: hypothetical protein DMF62_05900 [Acidobacteriota bacterium]
MLVGEISKRWVCFYQFVLDRIRSRNVHSVFVLTFQVLHPRRPLGPWGVGVTKMLLQKVLRFKQFDTSQMAGF